MGEGLRNAGNVDSNRRDTGRLRAAHTHRHSPDDQITGFQAMNNNKVKESVDLNPGILGSQTHP